MKILQFFFILIFLSLILLGCNNQNSSSENTSKDTTTTLTSINKTERRTGAFREPELVKVYGDTSINRSRIYYTERKFEPYLSFSAFPAKAELKGKPAKINYSSNKTARRYRTVINRVIENNGAEFGGVYAFARWGCGTSCQQSAVIDLRDGSVYDGPAASMGYQFKVNSRLLIVNPADSLGFIADCSYCFPEFWLWNEKLKKFEKQ